MSELKVHRFITTDELFPEANAGVLYYEKSEADKVIAELKNRIAPKQSDKTLQERLNEVCKKHAVSTLQDLDWSFCMVEARLEDYKKLAADKHEALEKMLQYKVLYKEMCRDINTQERFFAMKVAHANYKRCLAMANKCVYLCHKAKDLYRWDEDENLEHYYNHKIEFFARWHKRWLEIAEQFKPNNSTAQKGKGKKMYEANENLMTDCCENRRVRTNSGVVCDLAIERNQISGRLANLNKAIEADPEAVSAHHKELWRKQAKAMQEYVDVLGERIKDLIDNG